MSEVGPPDVIGSEEMSFERAYRRWGRISRRGEPERYVRQMLGIADDTATVADRDLLLRGLAALAPRQRAVLVLRYFEDLSEAQTAAMLSCSVGTVKSQAARGLARLRELTGEAAKSRRSRRPGREHHDPGRNHAT